MMIRTAAKGVLAALVPGFLCAVVLSAQTPSQSLPDLGRLFTQAQQAQRHGDYGAAAKAYEEILKIRPDLVAARINLGLMYYVSGDYHAAARTFEIVLKSNPQLYVANLFLGLDLLRLQRAQQALPYLHRAYSSNRKDEQVLLGLAACYETIGNFDDAITWYKRAIQANPKNPDTWYSVGMAYMRQQELAVSRLGRMGKNSAYARTLVAQSLLERGHASDAAKILQKVLASPSPPPCLRATLGFADVEQKELGAAQREFSTEIREHPGCLLAWLGQARVSLERNEPSAAINSLERVWEADQNFLRVNFPLFDEGLDRDKMLTLKELAPRFSKAGDKAALASFLAAEVTSLHTGVEESLALPRVAQGGSAVAGSQAKENSHELYAQGHYTQCARSLAAKGSQLQPSEMERLCECSYYSGDYSAAFAAGERLLRLRPQSMAGLYWEARAAQKLAVNSLVQAGLAAPDSPRMHLLLAELYLSRQQTKWAETEFQKVIKLQPQSIPAHLGLAASYELELHYADAIPELKQVLASDPAQPEGNYLMGAALVKQHHYSEAAPYLSKALKGNSPHSPNIHAMLAKIYAAQGHPHQAIAELKFALRADEDGSFHYQLYVLYRQLGNQKAAAVALAESQAIRKRNLQMRQALIMGSSGADSQSSAGDDVRPAASLNSASEVNRR